MKTTQEELVVRRIRQFAAAFLIVVALTLGVGAPAAVAAAHVTHMHPYGPCTGAPIPC